MRKLSLLAAALLVSAAGYAAEPETTFINGQGRVVIPHLVVGNDIYYAELDRTSASSYTFALDTTVGAKVTPTAEDDWATASEVTGTWSPAGSEVAITLNADGTYSWESPAGANCPAGVETGTYGLDEETGVLFFHALEDANGTCGASHASRVVRVARDAENLAVTLSYMQPGGKQVDTEISLEPLAE